MSSRKKSSSSSKNRRPPTPNLDTDLKLSDQENDLNQLETSESDSDHRANKNRNPSPPRKKNSPGPSSSASSASKKRGHQETSSSKHSTKKKRSRTRSKTPSDSSPARSMSPDRYDDRSMSNTRDTQQDKKSDQARRHALIKNDQAQRKYLAKVQVGLEDNPMAMDIIDHIKRNMESQFNKDNKPPLPVCCKFEADEKCLTKTEAHIKLGISFCRDTTKNDKRGNYPWQYHYCRICKSYLGLYINHRPQDCFMLEVVANNS